MERTQLVSEASPLLRGPQPISSALSAAPGQSVELGGAEVALHLRHRRHQLQELSSIHLVAGIAHEAAHSITDPGDTADLCIEVIEMTDEHIADRLTFEDVGDLGEWQSQAPQSADTVEPLGVALAIDAVSAVGSLTRDEQADLVVMMEGTDSETGGLREFPDTPGGHSSPSCTTSAMASAIRPCRAPGRLCPMPSIIISRAPGIASAVAIPPLGSHILSA